ncbi:uncharacterized protein LOC142774206 [Rhipicephalus microplus]|uniref:uncharacterized protein LOC142774206 n=1 Tax=Rhipicephalus microplus TaxID=6941 RepID=UPI003F6B76FE
MRKVVIQGCCGSSSKTDEAVETPAPYKRSNLSIETLENAVATWKSPYTAYAALCFSAFLGYQVVALTSISRSVDVHKTFPRHLRFVSYAITVAKVCVNYVSFCLGSQGLLEFLKGATAFETSTSFSAAVKRRLDRGRRLFDAVVRAMLFASFVGAFIIALADGLKKLPPTSAPWRAVVVTGALCCAMAFFLYDSTVHVITTRCSEVLLRYLESELLRLEANCSNQVAHCAQLNSASEIAAVRVNVCKIKALKAKLDKICGPAIAASSTSLLALLCLNVYRSFTMDVTESELWLPIVYTLYCGLCLVEMAFVSQDLAKQAKKLKNTTKSVAMIRSSKEYVQQIRYLHSTIEPEEMCLTGASFFRLDRGLLLRGTGSVITFAVILMQTDGDLKRRMGLH